MVAPTDSIDTARQERDRAVPIGVANIDQSGTATGEQNPSDRNQRFRPPPLERGGLGGRPMVAPTDSIEVRCKNETGGAMRALPVADEAS